MCAPFTSWATASSTLPRRTRSRSGTCPSSEAHRHRQRHSRQRHGSAAVAAAAAAHGHGGTAASAPWAVRHAPRPALTACWASRCVRVACALRARCVRVAAMADGGRTRTLSRARVQLLMTDVEAAGTRGADGTLWSAHMQACRGCGTGTLLTSGAVHAPQSLDESGSTVSEIIPSFLKISNQ